MKIPTQVSILGISYVIENRELANEDGFIDPRTQKIVLADSISPEKREQVFLHELVHGILDQLCYGDLYEDEHLVQGLAVGLHEALSSFTT